MYPLPDICLAYFSEVKGLDYEAYYIALYDKDAAAELRSEG